MNTMVDTVCSNSMDITNFHCASGDTAVSTRNLKHYLVGRIVM